MRVEGRLELSAMTHATDQLAQPVLLRVQYVFQYQTEACGHSTTKRAIITMMFGRKKLMARIAELEREVVFYKEQFENSKESVFKMGNIIKSILSNDCEHEYQLVCAVVFSTIEPDETGGLFASGKNQENLSKTYFHSYEDKVHDSDLIAVYAYRCKNCQHLKPATCFDVASAAGFEWSEYQGPMPYDALRYSVCEDIVKSKKPSGNKLDSIVEECEKLDL